MEKGYIDFIRFSPCFFFWKKWKSTFGESDLKIITISFMRFSVVWLVQFLIDPDGS